MNIHVTLRGSINYDLQNNVFLMYSIPSYLLWNNWLSTQIFSLSVLGWLNEKVEESREKVFLLSLCIIILYLIQQGNVNFKAKIQIIQGSSIRFPSHFSISFCYKNTTMFLYSNSTRPKVNFWWFDYTMYNVVLLSC